MNNGGVSLEALINILSKIAVIRSNTTYIKVQKGMNENRNGTLHVRNGENSLYKMNIIIVDIYILQNLKNTANKCLFVHDDGVNEYIPNTNIVTLDINNESIHYTTETVYCLKIWAIKTI